MSNISLDISEKINPNQLAVLRAIKDVADSLNIAFFVVGASARDFILKHCYNVTPHRMTMDVDIGVEVADWNEFEKLIQALIATGDFTQSREKQRLLFNTGPVDIIPFGPIVNDEKKVAWPPEHEIFMSMLGFEEAYAYSMTVRISNDPPLDIKLPTLPGLVLMKLISWNDKPSDRGKDAEDILFIMENYYRAGNENRLYELEQDILAEEKFDIQLAGIRLLGKDIVVIADPETLEAVKALLDKETGEQPRYRLVEAMIKQSLEHDKKFDHVLGLVEKLNHELNNISQE